MKIRFYADTTAVGRRIDVVLGEIESIGSRTRAAQLLKLGLVLVNQKPAVPSLRISLNDEIIFEIPEPKNQELELKPYAEGRIEVIHLDDDLVVVNKPPGLVTHPSVGHPSDSLVNALIHQGISLSEGFSQFRPGIVHRLDRETSGLIVVARTYRAQRALATAFANRSIGRKYEAICHGCPQPLNGRLESLLGRDPHYRQRMASLNKGRTAITRYQTLVSWHKAVSLVECQLETGRTHQIRVHFKDLNCPLLGDTTYGASPNRFAGYSLPQAPLTQLLRKVPRVALHAKTLEFEHPISKVRLQFQSDWPADLLPVVNELRAEL